MKITTLEIAGLKSAFKGLRNPMNSWEQSDSKSCADISCENCPHNNDICESNILFNPYIIGNKDMNLADRMIMAGASDCKFLRQIQVWADMDMPRYFWSEFDTYHFNSKNSCSTMHKLLNNKNEITKDLFVICPEDEDILEIVVKRLEELRLKFLNSTSAKEKDYLLLRAKRLLMEGFLQLRTVNTNYMELRNMYHQRKNHRLKEEWRVTFCEWVKTLPYAQELIIGNGDD